MRPPSASCNWLNLSDFSSVAGYTATGIVTKPKEMAPLHMDLGMIGTPPGCRPSACGNAILPRTTDRHPTDGMRRPKSGWPARLRMQGRSQRLVGRLAREPANSERGTFHVDASRTSVVVRRRHGRIRCDRGAGG